MELLQGSETAFCGVVLLAKAFWRAILGNWGSP
jgi:hypothetical protein